MGETGRIRAAVPPWGSCAALTRFSSVALVWSDSDPDSASSRSSSSCPSGGWLGPTPPGPSGSSIGCIGGGEGGSDGGASI
eukprot:706320-Pleurochrysis_carterae.AAC.1